MADPFTDSARQHVIRPTAGSGFRIRGDIGRNDVAGKSRHWEIAVVAGAARALDQRCVMPRPVVLTVAFKASEIIRQILAASQSLRRGFEGAIGQGTNAWADERPPADA